MDLEVDPTGLHQSLDRLCDSLVQSIGSTRSQVSFSEPSSGWTCHPSRSVILYYDECSGFEKTTESDDRGVFTLSKASKNIRVHIGVELERAGAFVKELREEELPTSSGYLPVGNSNDSRLFYVFYEASSSCLSIKDTPLMLWLNGGPGCSSLIGCFYEIGPWIVDESGELHSNQWAWNRRCGVLFLDSPVGTGFSVEESDEDIPRDQETVSQHLQYALQRFVTENEGFTSRPLFLAGESYAGKYLPALAHDILHKPRGPHGHHLASQLAGLMIGNGLTDPRIQVQCHADVALSFGLLDKRQAAYVQRMAQEAVGLIDREEWVKSHERRTALCNFIEKTSGVATLLDIRRTTKYHHTQDGVEFLAQFLNAPDVRNALKVESDVSWVGCNRKVRSCLVQDTMKSVKWMVEAILRRGLPVLLYQGMYDVKDGHASSEAWMRTLDWQGSNMFWKRDRACWKVNGELAGYWRQGLNLTHVLVAGAGHQVPADQPLFSQVMIETWMQEQLTGKTQNKENT